MTSKLVRHPNNKQKSIGVTFIFPGKKAQLKTPHPQE